jgi:hypothetical protein
MPRPFTKKQILSASQQEYQTFEQLLTALSPAQMIQPGTLGEWSVKDTLAHLYAWQQMVLDWIDVSQNGQTPSVPARGFKWSQLPALNQQIYEQHRHRPLPEVLEMFQTSYQQTMAFIENLSEEELFTLGRFPWMNKNTLAAYFVSCTSSHYRWARTEIKKGLKKSADM